MATMIIHTQNLRKTFRARSKKGEQTVVEAVRGVDLAVREGEVFGLLGPNGAGKTTTMRMLATLLTPTGGQAEIAGSGLDKPAAIRQKIGYVSQVGGMERWATGMENLVFQGKLYGMSTGEARERAQELIEELGLATFAGRKSETYSGGQRRIFDLAVGIVHRPKVLFLDEPTTGLDPQARATVWRQIERLRESGTTVFLTTHYLEEADKLCDRIAIMDHGEVIKLGEPRALKQELSDVVTLELDADLRNPAAELLQSESFVRNIEQTESGFRVYVRNGEETLLSMVRCLDRADIIVQSLEFSAPTLDDIFLELTGRSLRDEETAMDGSDT